MKPKMALKLYQFELGGAFAVYALILVVSIKIGQNMPDGIERTLVVLSPMFGFFLAIWAITRFMQRMDEYQRQFTLESIAIATGVTMGATFTYGFLEGIGYPRLSMFVVWGVMCIAFMAVQMIRGICTLSVNKQ